ncbi:MAG TPA: hypothetical protein PKW35_23030 [Nannocystaceae bacterium]|nr:hypothetical protein [Nannocystaceae bacterium]
MTPLAPSGRLAITMRFRVENLGPLRDAEVDLTKYPPELQRRHNHYGPASSPPAARADKSRK